MADQQMPVWMQPYAGRNVLVTGAFGFLGSHLTRALAGSGANVAALDTATAPTRASQINLVAGLREAIEVHTGDVTDPEFLRAVFARRRFDYVFHFAAFASVIERATAHPTETLLVNSTGVVHLLAAAVDTGQDLRCFLHASTDKIYGDHDGATYSEQSMEFRCEGVYEASKLAADVFARTYRRAYGLPVAVARMCNVFGPYDIDGMASRLVPRSMASIFRDTAAPEVYDSSRQHRRDWLFVDDCCRALLSLATSDMKHMESAVFHVPGIAHLSTQDMCVHVIDAAASAADRAGDARTARAVRAAGYRIGPPASNAGAAIGVQHTNGERLFTHVGFRPQVSLQDGLAQTAEFYRTFFTSRGRAQGPGTTQNG